MTKLKFEKRDPHTHTIEFAYFSKEEGCDVHAGFINADGTVSFSVDISLARLTREDLLALASNAVPYDSLPKYELGVVNKETGKIVPIF